MFVEPYPSIIYSGFVSHRDAQARLAQIVSRIAGGGSESLPSDMLGMRAAQRQSELAAKKVQVAQEVYRSTLDILV